MATPLNLTFPSKTHTRLSAACQQLHSEDFSQLQEPQETDGSAPTARVTVRSTLADARLWPVVNEHRCNGIALTPSGLYADMAVTVAQYIWRRMQVTVPSLREGESFEDGLRGEAKEGGGGIEGEAGAGGRGALESTYPGIAVLGLDVVKPLIASEPQPAGGQWIEMETVVSFPFNAPGEQDVPGSNKPEQINAWNALLTCKIRSITPSGTKLTDLAHCTVRYESWQSWLTIWNDMSPAILARISQLHWRAHNEYTLATPVRQIFRERAYDLFRSFVDYGPRYRNMAEVVFDCETLEATSTVDFQNDFIDELVGGSFWLDGSCHVSGFVCNAVDPDRERFAFISHGIGGMRISPSFDPLMSQGGGDGTRNYVRMERDLADASVMTGDVFVLQQGRVVGVWEGVKFKRIPRKVLNVFLSPRKPSPPSSSTTSATTVKTARK